MVYNFAKIESKRQKEWEEKKIFQVKWNPKKKKFYVLVMFPYPSGTGLHMGHALNYAIADIYARFKRMQGFNVLNPMGYDALGLPAENAAIKVGTHPEDYTKASMKNFMKQQKKLGLSYDWSRLVNTSSPDYYKWDQWIFLKMFEKGLAYQKEASVNWCPSCKTVLANEQAQTGSCERCKTKVEIKTLKQWFFRITDYADELLDKLDDLDWPQRTKTMQRNWIGKSEGTEIDFEVDGFGKFPVFTTRPDTIYGVTFMVISAQHPKLMELVSDEQKKEVENFLKRLKGVSEKQLGDLEKEGVFTGSYAINPVTKEKIPIWAGNFVVADYGSGMVMAVPAHDQRDFEFAKKYGIEIKSVIIPRNIAELKEGRKSIPYFGDKVNFNEVIKQMQEKGFYGNRAYIGEGKLINSGRFNGLDNNEAKWHISTFLEGEGLARKKVQFKLRDWLISRQRYWGTPIPVVYCDKCGAVAVDEKDLPVKLPKKVKFGEGNPLETNEKWISAKCPKCGGKARRETDTMDTFVNSSWYFLRYCDPQNSKKIFDKKKVDYWCPIDQYIGGAEHACMHLIYFRFYTKFLRDIGVLDFDEPALKMFHQGMLHGPDGEKMSKSRGNVIDPLDTIKSYGTDALRLALVSSASPDSDTNWDEKIIIGSSKFLNRVWDYFEKVKISKKSNPKIESGNRKFPHSNFSKEKLESKLNKIIKEVTNQIENFKYNLAVIKIRELFNFIFGEDEVSRNVLEKSLKLLHVFCPHITEELFEKLGNKKSIYLSEWPVAEEKKIDDKFEKQDKIVQKLVADIVHVKELMKIREKRDIKKVYVYVLPNEKEFYSEKEVSKRVGKDVRIFAVNDKDKYDPENKSKKVKPGRPGIYLE